LGQHAAAVTWAFEEPSSKPITMSHAAPEGDMRDIKVGDYVIWRPRPNAMPVTGCKVLEFGETEDGRPAARLDCGRLGEINALVEHLTLESDQD
jgi:hypothetical protein